MLGLPYSAYRTRLTILGLSCQVLHGKLRTRCGPSAKSQPKKQGIAETFAQCGPPPNPRPEL